MAPTVMLIGAGRMGWIRAEDLAPLAGELIVANRSPEAAREIVATFGGRAIALEDILDHPADAYVLATSTASHAALLDSLIPTGRPILCEKPIAPSMADTASLIAKAERAGTPVQVGFMRRFDPEIAQARDSIADGTAGILYAIHMISHDHQPAPPEFIAGSAGIFQDLHVHDFDLVRWLTGSAVETVYASRSVRNFTRYADHDDADTSMIHLVTESGVQVAISGTRHGPLGHDVHMEIFGSQDSIGIGIDDRTPLHCLSGRAGLNHDPYLGFVDRFREAFRRETAAFIDMVNGTRGNPCPPESALEATRVAIACERSVSSGLPVQVRSIVVSSVDDVDASIAKETP
jgi:myo-inositol 2-dehydrogenase/D-chiro-inositol 1-dehydrogenase